MTSKRRSLINLLSLSYLSKSNKIVLYFEIRLTSSNQSPYS